MRQLEVTGTTLHVTQEIWVYWLPEAEFLAWMFCSCKESLWLISFKAIPSKNSVVVTSLTILVGQGKLQIQHVTASKPNWEYTNKYSPQCLDFNLRHAVYTNTPLSCCKQAQRRENFLVYVLSVSYQHQSSRMWISYPFYIYSHHQWHRTTDNFFNVWFNIYQMRKAVTNRILLKHHASACLLLEDLL